MSPTAVVSPVNIGPMKYLTCRVLVRRPGQHDPEHYGPGFIDDEIADLINNPTVFGEPPDEGDPEPTQEQLDRQAERDAERARREKDRKVRAAAKLARAEANAKAAVAASIKEP